MADLDDDALFAALESEAPTIHDDARVSQLNAELASMKNNHTQKESSSILTNEVYPTLSNDQSVLDLTTGKSKCLVHFAHPDFPKCEVMDMRLAQLASTHFDVSFSRVDVRNTPFIAEKLGIRVLPCVIGFKDGAVVHRVIGFQGLGPQGFDEVKSFDVRVLEKRLVKNGILGAVKLGDGDDDDDERDESDEEIERQKRPKRGIRSANRVRNREDDDDDDWD